MIGFRHMRRRSRSPVLRWIRASIMALCATASLLGWSSDSAALSKAGHHRNRIAVLNERLEAATAQLTFRPGSGYLKSVLDALSVPVESQVMAFSPTSFQGKRVSQDNPWAIYFGDDAAVAWVRGSSLLEAVAVDRENGVTFYTLDQTPGAKPRFRKNESCLLCHQSER